MLFNEDVEAAVHTVSYNGSLCTAALADSTLLAAHEETQTGRQEKHGGPVDRVIRTLGQAVVWLRPASSSARGAAVR